MKYSLEVPQSTTTITSCEPSPAWVRGAAFVWDCLPALTLFVILRATFLPSLALPNLDAGLANIDINSSTDLSASLLQYLLVLLHLFLVSWIGYALWNVVFEALWGTTPGKWLVGLRVVSTPNPQSCPAQEGLTWATSALRFFAAGVSWATLNVGHAMGRWRADKAMLHDLLSKTRVVVDPAVHLPILGRSRAEIQTLCAILAWVLVGAGLVYKLVVFVQTIHQLANLA